MVIVVRCEEGSVAVGDDGERETEFSHMAPCHPAQYTDSLIRTHSGQKKVSRLVRCPDFRGCNGVFGTAKSVLFIEVS